MLFKNFTVFQLENFELIFHRLFTDELDADFSFNGAIPDELETLPESTSTTGFRAPSLIDIQLACDLVSPRTDRLYLFNHIRREKKFDTEGIRDKCIREAAAAFPDKSFDEVEQECARRVKEAKAIAPIKDTKTPLYLRSDGKVIIGAGLNVAKGVVRDLINAFGTDDDLPGWVTVEGDSSRFNNRHFYTRCEDLLDRDVFDDDNYPYDTPSTVRFNNEFTVKLPDKASMSIKNISELPVALRSTLHGAEYTAIGVSVFTNNAEYQMKVTNLGEFKSVKLDSELDDIPLRFWFNEMLAIHAIVAGALAALEEEA